MLRLQLCPRTCPIHYRGPNLNRALKSDSPEMKISMTKNLMLTGIKILSLMGFVATLVSCGTVQSDVTRFHTLPPRGSGQTFVIRSATSRNALEFEVYASRVASHLKEYGWMQIGPGSADFNVFMAYKMGGSHERHGSVPIVGQTGGGTTYHSGSVNTYGSSGSAYGSYSGSSYTPATFGVVGSATYSETVYDRYLDIKIRDRAGRAVFEGRVVSTGSNSEIAAVLPQMIDSLFTGFPGESGKTKRIEKNLQ